MTRDCDVAIVGFGPVGALTALSLADAGVRVAVLERSVDAVELPRAVALDGESVRAFQRIGLDDEVKSILQAARDRDEICFANSRHERLFGIDVPRVGPNGWRDVSFFDQPELEALLRARVADRPEIDVSLGREVTAIRQSADEVVLQTRRHDGAPADDVRAAFVVGCDGASSFVRRTLGIVWQSLGYDQDWLVIDIQIRPGAELPLATMQVCDPARLTSYICVKDPNRRWEFQLLEGETREQMLRPERIRSLLDPWLPADQYTIRRAAVYQFHAATAATWRERRVLLAGDAAHQTPPFLGQGLNAGFRDAVNLGWKLPLVLGGHSDASLLDSYAEERDPHARDLVERAVWLGRLMENVAAREIGLPDPHTPDVMAASNPDGRLVPPLRAGVLIGGQIGPESPVGNLIRQPTLRGPDGAERRFDDLLGRGFAIVGREHADLKLGKEASAIWQALGGTSAALAGWSVSLGELDRLFETHPAVVLRPDRYVFGVVDAVWDLDRLVRELGRLLRLR